MRAAASFLALLIALCLAQPGAAVAAAEPRVVLIVGPSGAATALYRERAEAAAKVAEKYTSNVVRVYSPHATWRAVKRALDGAAIVVYLGHGNGWPSRYRDSPFGVSQNGFGLNPVAGDGDDAHQYFGEDRIAAEVSLGRNAVVLLHHLCYASGNTEPGMPQGTVEQARQRVDNYAAGFIAAGAGAVVAEAHMSPAWYLQRLLTGSRSIDEVWQTSPTAHGNAFSFKSQRSPGFAAAMDPDTAEGGFYRSIVYRGGVGAGRLEASGRASALGAYEPTLVGTGFEAGLPYFKDRPTAGAAVQLWIPYETNEPESVQGLKVGVRWDPIEVDDLALPDAATPAAEAPPEDSAAREAAPPADGSIDPMTAPVNFVEPERIGEVVEPVDAPAGPTRIVPTVTVPDAPGRYRMVLTLHDSSGDAFDVATQALMPSLIVYVSGEIGARYTVAGA